MEAIPSTTGPAPASPPPKGAVLAVAESTVPPAPAPGAAPVGGPSLAGASPSRPLLERVARSLSTLGLGDVGRRHSHSTSASREGSVRRGARAVAAVAPPTLPEVVPAPSPPPPPPPPPPPSAVPIFYDSPPAAGPAPAPRWGHAAAALDGKLYVIGGVGAAVFDDVAAYDPAAGAWRAVPTSGNGGSGNRGRRGSSGAPTSSSLGGPGPVFGAAAASSGPAIFVYGGRQGRAFLKTTHEFRPADGAWRALPPPPGGRASPPAVAGHTLTACGRHGLVLYGGGGRRVSGAAWRLDPTFGVWHKMWEPGAPGPAGPRPRHGHSAVWAPGGGGGPGGGRDRLVIFGGAGADGTAYADAWALDLADRTWARVDVPGAVPALLAPPTAGERGGSAAPATTAAVAGSPHTRSALMAALRAAAGGHPAPPAASAAGSGQPGAPCPRFSHCAAMLPPPGGREGAPGAGGPAAAPATRMWVFGGCTPDGTFLNDAAILDLASGRWCPAPPVGPPPAPRYGHSATLVGGRSGGSSGGSGEGEGTSSTPPPRLILYGGSDARQPFGTVVSVVSDFGPTLGAAAADLMRSRAPGSLTPAGGAGGGGGGGGGSSGGATNVTPTPPASADPDVSIHSIRSAGSLDDGGGGGAAGPSSSLRTSTDQASWLAEALRKRSAVEAHAAAARAAAASDAAARAERARADALAADLAAARMLLEEREAASSAAALAAAAQVADARAAVAAAADRAADAEAAAAVARSTAAASSTAAEAADRSRASAEASAAEAAARADRAAADARAAADLVAAARRERDAAREAGVAAAGAAARSAAGEATARAAAVALARRLPELAVASTAPFAPPFPDLAAHPAAAAAALDRLAEAARGAGGGGGGPPSPLSTAPLPALRALASAAGAASDALRGAVEARLEAELAAARRASSSGGAGGGGGGDGECKVCMDAPPDSAFLPCGHTACGACAAAAGESCPFCRRAVADVARLYEA